MKEEFKEELLEHIDNEEIRTIVCSNLPRLSFALDKDYFLELIKELLKYPDGLNFIKNNWKILLNNSKESVKLLEVIKEVPEIAEEIISDVPYIIDYGNIDDTGEIANQISTLKGGEQAITDNFERLLEFCFSHFDTIFCSALKTEEGRNLVRENFEIIKKEASLEEFFSFIKKLEGIPEFEKEYEKYSFWAELYSQIMTDELPDYILEDDPEDVMWYRKNKDSKFLALIDSDYSDEKKMILERIAKGRKYTFKSFGNSSMVIQVGDQIVKFGYKKAKFEVPYHPRIMMPYFRKKYDDDSFIEVYNFGDVENAKINDEELLKIYKELEEAGIIWGDARKDNVLVLLKDNDLPEYIVSEDFNVMGFLEDKRFPTTNHKALKKGELVICDLDYLYAKGDPEYREGLIDSVIGEYIQSKKKKDEIQFE